MKQRYAQSELAAEISDKLRSVRKGALTESAIEEFGPGLQRLDKALYKAAEYNYSFLRLSAYSLCTVGEYVGYTWGNIVEVVQKTGKGEGLGTANLFSDPDLFAKHMFELVYGAHALYDRLGAIHGDLHLNNMTFHRRFYTDRMKKGDDGQLRSEPIFERPVAAYVLKDQRDTYLVPHYGAHSVIIDFSRSVLDARGAAARYPAEPLKREFFLRDQTSRLLRTLGHYLPEYTEKRLNKLGGLAKARPDLFVRILAAVDPYAVGAGFAGLAAKAREEGLEVHPDCEARALRLKAAARRYLIENFSRALAGEFSEAAGLAEKARGGGLEVHPNGGTPQRKAAACRYLAENFSRTSADGKALGKALGGAPGETPGYPEPPGPLPTSAGEAVMAEAFDYFAYDSYSPKEVKTMTLLDVHRLNAPMRYSTEEYDKFPPYARIEEARKHLGDYAETSDGGVSYIRCDHGLDGRLEKSFRPDPFLDVLVEEAQVRDERPPPASSPFGI